MAFNIHRRKSKHSEALIVRAMNAKSSEMYHFVSVGFYGNHKNLKVNIFPSH